MDLSRVQELFRLAVELEPEKWPAFLDAHCGADGELRAEVEALLARHQALDGRFLEPSPTVTAAMRELLGATSDDHAAPDPLIGQRIGAYRIKTRIAVGGMASVYEAVQQRPHRVVALKVMRHNIASKSALRRFEFEAQILARMRHPNIAQIYDAGTARIAGVTMPWFAMEYIPGARTVTEYAHGRRLTTRERLELFARICDAVHHGHTRGVIHRDLKPANILIDPRGEPKIIDFGVARATDSDLALTTQQTHVGQLVGTMQYMSPEQCDADPHDIDTRSDVYSLGVVLYELLTSRLPYDASSRTIYQVTRIIKEKVPEPIGRVDPRLRGDVETIVHKALEKDRDRRYASAAELAADIRRYLAGEPIAARKPSLWYVMSRYARRHQAAFVGVAAVFAVLVGAVVVAGSLAAWARTEQRRAELARLEAETQRRQAELQATLARLGLAQARLEDYDPGAARVALDQVPEAQRGWVWRHLYNTRLDQSALVLPLTPTGRGETHLSLASTGSRLSCVANADGFAWKCWIYDVVPDARNNPLRKVGAVRIGTSNRHVLGPQGRWMWTTLNRSGRRVGIILWNLAGSDQPHCAAMWRVEGQGAVTGLSVVPGGARGEDGTPCGQPMLAAADGARGRVYVARLADLIEQAASVNMSAEPTVEALENAPPLPVFATLTGLTRDMDLVASPSGRWLAGVSRDHLAALWDMDRVRSGPEGASHEAVALMVGHRDHVLCAAFSPDETCLATGSVDKTVRLWDLRPLLESDSRDGTSPVRLPCIGILNGHTGPVRALAFSADGRTLYSAGSDRTVRVWQVRHNAPVTDIRTRIADQATFFRLRRTLYGDSAAICSLVVLPNGAVVSVASNGQVRIWLSDRDPLPHTAAHYSSVRDACWTQDERYLITLDSHYCVNVWDPESLEPLARRFVGEVGSPRRLAAWPRSDGTGHWILVTAGGNRITEPRHLLAGLLLFRLDADGELRRVARYAPPDSDVCGFYCALAVSREGRRIAVGTSKGFVEVLDLRLDGDTPAFVHRRRILVRRGADLMALTFLDGAGRWLIAGDGLTERLEPPYALRLWDLERGSCIGTLPAHTAPITSLAARADRRMLASASEDRTVRLWRITWASGRPRLVPDGPPLRHPGVVSCVAFRPGRNDRLFCGTFASQIFVWDVSTRSQVASLAIPLGPVNQLRFCRDGERLAVPSGGDQGAGNVAWVFETQRADLATIQARARTTRGLDLIDELFWDPDVRSITQYQQRIRQLAAESRDPLTREAAERIAQRVRLWLPHPEWYYRRFEHVLRKIVAADADAIRDVIPWAELAADLWPERYRPMLTELRRRLDAQAHAARP